MDNLEKLATQSAQDENNDNNNTTQYVLDTTMYKQTQIRLIRHQPSYQKTGGKEEPNMVFMRKS